MSTTALDPAAKLLARTPTRDLLRAAYQLTHRLHQAQTLAGTRGYPDRASARDLANDLRAQRDMIDAEIDRRCGQ